MRVAAVQFKARPRDPDGSREILVGLADRAGIGVDLLVLPEMAITGYSFEGPAQVRKVAEPPEGPTFTALSRVAKSRGCWLVAGFPEDAGERLYNSAWVINPAGELAFVYRKSLLYETDKSWATPGDSGYASFDTQNGSFSVGICMDLNDDKFLYWCRQKQPRAIALPTNWLDQALPVWSYWAWRMLRLPDTALVAANSYGQEPGITFSGQSAVLDGGGVLAIAPKTGDQIIAATLAKPKKS